MPPGAREGEGSPSGPRVHDTRWMNGRRAKGCTCMARGRLLLVLRLGGVVRGPAGRATGYALHIQRPHKPYWPEEVPYTAGSVRDTHAALSPRTPAHCVLSLSLLPPQTQSLCEEKQRRIAMARMELERLNEGRKGGSVRGGLGGLMSNGGSNSGSNGGLLGLELGLGLGGGVGSSSATSSPSAGSLGPRRWGFGSVVGGLMGSWGGPAKPQDTIRSLEAEVASLTSLHKWVGVGRVGWR